MQLGAIETTKTPSEMQDCLTINIQIQSLNAINLLLQIDFIVILGLACHPNFMKPCIKQYFDFGLHEEPLGGGWHHSRNKEIAMLIISEFKRLGHERSDVKQSIRAWNARCSPAMPPREADRHLICLVDWIFDHFKGDYGCGDEGFLVQNSYCFRHERTCEYFSHFQRINSSNNFLYDPVEYDTKGWARFLQQKYSNGRLADEVYRKIRGANHKKQFSVIYIGLQSIATQILNSTREFTILSPVQIRRAIHLLENENLISLVERGKRGLNSRKANGYRLNYPVPDLAKSNKKSNDKK
ncbi:hypothetical protein E3V55_03560 [Candidatus Marinimicrobia bacterium MT.SAG.3]|nr:hypothetical protein E3V55_03560 [Candidatus Marinimicrobia bacterium MT.SAG.3]